MSERPDQETIVSNWIERAEHDLIAAEHTLTLKNSCPYDTICFHAQQCVEKYIKALLLHHKINFPKIHDIIELIGMLPSEHKIPLTPDQQSKLSSYVIAGRYPIDNMDDLTKMEAEQAIALAKKIREHIRNYLKIK